MRVRFWCAVLGAAFLMALTIAAWSIPFSRALAPNYDAILLNFLSWEHPLGTDEYGRDTLVRLIVGSRYSLLSALTVTASAFVVGWPLGLLFRRAPAWLRFIPLCLAYVYFIDPKTLLSPRWPSRALIGLVFAGGVAPVLLFLILAASVVHRLDNNMLSHFSNGIILAPMVIFAMLQPPTAGNSASPAPRADWALAALVFSSALFTQAFLDSIGLGTLPPTPTWGTALSSFRIYPELLLPKVAIYITMVLTAASVLVISDEIVARHNRRRMLRETASHPS